MHRCDRNPSRAWRVKVASAQVEHSFSGRRMDRTTVAGPYVVARTYSGQRATSATGGGLRPSATVSACRGLLGQDRGQCCVRRRPLLASSCQVPRPWQRRRVSYLPQGTAHSRVVGVRREAGRPFRLGPDGRRTGASRGNAGGVLGTRGRGVPVLQLEPPRAVLRARRGPGTETATTAEVRISATEPPHSERVTQSQALTKQVGVRTCPQTWSPSTDRATPQTLETCT